MFMWNNDSARPTIKPKAIGKADRLVCVLSGGIYTEYASLLTKDPRLRGALRLLRSYVKTQASWVQATRPIGVLILLYCGVTVPSRYAVRFTANLHMPQLMVTGRMAGRAHLTLGLATK